MVISYLLERPLWRTGPGKGLGSMDRLNELTFMS